MEKIYLALGTNMGERTKNLKRAIELINERIGKVEKQSFIMESKAEGFVAPDFLNQVVMSYTTLTPMALLEATQGIERDMGRTEKTYIENGKPKYHNRIIDIDILTYSEIELSTEKLIIPHPKMQERSFVMEPLKSLLQ